MKFYIYTGLLYIGGILYGLGLSYKDAVLAITGLITSLMGIILLTYLFEHIKDQLKKTEIVLTGIVRIIKHSKTNIIQRKE